MANQNIARLGVVLGLDMAEFSSGVEKAIQENKKLKNSIQRETNAAAKEILALEYAVRDYGRQVSKTELIQREFIAGGKYANATQGMKTLLLERAKAYDALAMSANNADKAMAKGAGMDRYLKQALAYQTTDIVTSLAGGQNPLMVLLQQGGQLKDQFGGFKPLFAGIAEAVTLSRVAFAGLAGAVAGLAYAFYKGSDEAQKFRDSLILTNNFAGLTTSSFDALSKTISEKANISIGDSKLIMEAMVASGKVARDNLTSLGVVIGNVVKLTGEDADTVSQRLIPALDGSASSAKKLNEQYHFLNLSQYKQIENLARQGKLQESAKMTMDLFNQSIEDQTREVGFLEKAWSGTGKALSNFWNQLKEIGKDDTLQQQLDSAYERVRDLSRHTNEGMTTSQRQKAIADAIKEADDIRAKLYEKEQAAKAKSLQAQKDQQQIENYAKAGGVEKAVSIEYEIRKQAMDKAYQDSLFNANEMEKVQIESARRIAEKSLEIEKQNIDEKGVFAAQRYQQLAEFVLTEEKRAAQERQKISRDTYLAYEKKQIGEKDALDMEKQRMGIYQSNFFITEQEAKLAERKLETQQKIAEIVRDLNNGKLGADAATKLIEEQEAIGKTKDEIIGLGEKLQYIKDVNQAVFSSMTQAIQAFLITGKFNFKNFALSVVASLMQIQAQMAAMAAMRGLGSIFGSMFGGFAGLGGTSYTSQGMGGSFSGPGFQIPPMAADGGFISGPTIVGENGPELFVPQGAGTIIPNQQMNDYGGGQPQNVFNGPYIANMQAIDTQSGIQFLAKNKMTIWSMNQSANRSVPAGR